ncbi:MAG: hypothetical protein RLY78_2021 [Pseudomonadota bacterium]|jgi:hypothetical protein
MSDAPPPDALDSPARILAEQTLRQWPSLQQRLGARQNEFLQSALAQCARHRLLDDETATLRFLTLCCALGTDVVEQPGHEPLAELLADPRLRAAERVHQVMRHCVGLLQQQGGSTDARLLLQREAGALDWLAQRRRAHDADAAPLARSSCDLDALTLRRAPTASRAEYRLQEGRWARLPVADLSLPVHVDRHHRAPRQVHLLGAVPGVEGPDGTPIAPGWLDRSRPEPVRLQLRLGWHGGCAEHPRVEWTGEHGVQRWQGREVQQLDWALPARDAPAAADGLQTRLLHEVPPTISQLRIDGCGLRDEGPSLGRQALHLHVHPATQWLFALQHQAVREIQLPAGGNRAAQAEARTAAARARSAGAGAASPITDIDGRGTLPPVLHDALDDGTATLSDALRHERHSPALHMLRRWPQPQAEAPTTASLCLLERDGQMLPTQAWVQAFDQALPQAMQAGLQLLWQSWQSQGARQASLRCRHRLLQGRQVMAWGWRESPAGNTTPPLLRCHGEFDIGCEMALQLQGEVAHGGGARSVAMLQVEGRSLLRETILRDRDSPDHATLAQRLSLRWRWPWRLQLWPLAQAGGMLAGSHAPLEGALRGAAGLRPRRQGGGWEWFVHLECDALSARVRLQDPLLGWSEETLPLLPAQTLLDWSVG